MASREETIASPEGTRQQYPSTQVLEPDSTSLPARDASATTICRQLSSSDVLSNCTQSNNCGKRKAKPDQPRKGSTKTNKQQKRQKDEQDGSDDDYSKEPWSKEEDELLLAQIAALGRQNWSKIAAAIPRRSGKSCRLRWCNELDPNINKGAYSQLEDAAVIGLRAKYGNKWAFIAKQLPGRTDNSVKNRWNSTLSKHMEEFRLKNQYLRENVGLDTLLSKLKDSAEEEYESGDENDPETWSLDPISLPTLEDIDNYLKVKQTRNPKAEQLRPIVAEQDSIAWAPASVDAERPCMDIMSVGPLTSVNHVEVPLDVDGLGDLPPQDCDYHSLDALDPASGIVAEYSAGIGSLPESVDHYTIATTDHFPADISQYKLPESNLLLATTSDHMPATEAVSQCVEHYSTTAGADRSSEAAAHGYAAVIVQFVETDNTLLSKVGCFHASGPVGCADAVVLNSTTSASVSYAPYACQATVNSWDHDATPAHDCSQVSMRGNVLFDCTALSPEASHVSEVERMSLIDYVHSEYQPTMGMHSCSYSGSCQPGSDLAFFTDITASEYYYGNLDCQIPN